MLLQAFPINCRKGFDFCIFTTCVDSRWPDLPRKLMTDTHTHTEKWLHSTELGTELHWFHLCMCTWGNNIYLHIHRWSCWKWFNRMYEYPTESQFQSYIIICYCSTPLWTFLDYRQFFITYEKLKNVFWLNFTGIILSDQKFHYSTDCQCTTSIEFIQYYIQCTTISVHDSCMVIIIKSSVNYTGYATSTSHDMPSLV